MRKLKSASEHYEETKENLLKICESIDKISLTHQTLTNNIREVLAEMEKTNLDNKKTKEFIQGLYDEAKDHLREETQRHEAAVEASLTKKFNDISDEVRKQIDKVHQENTNQSKSLRLVKALLSVAIIVEVAIIILMFLF
jgi:predicted AlkP superfamily phosphohydrolase/phosphomutase